MKGGSPQFVLVIVIVFPPLFPFFAWHQLRIEDEDEHDNEYD
jgi:hypothetical protein